jgi:hypothetical protein
MVSWDTMLKPCLCDLYNQKAWEPWGRGLKRSIRNHFQRSMLIKLWA